jgi:hypothetical protein
MMGAIPDPIADALIAKTLPLKLPGPMLDRFLLKKPLFAIIR